MKYLGLTPNMLGCKSTRPIFLSSTCDNVSTHACIGFCKGLNLNRFLLVMIGTIADVAIRLAWSWYKWLKKNLNFFWIFLLVKIQNQEFFKEIILIFNSSWIYAHMFSIMDWVFVKFILKFEKKLTLTQILSDLHG